jgi:predicted NAD-dependent protein-ADP-ribosyltransferase YbiA (DUF1768 family)
MQVRLLDGRLILIPESAAERGHVDAWKSEHAGHVLLVRADVGKGLALGDLGPREAACREPINVVSSHKDERIRLLSNFAWTPFELDGKRFNTVEGFWQGLKFPIASDRLRLARLTGIEAKRAGRVQGLGDTFEYGGEQIRVSTRGHWQLMEQANWAKYSQVAEAREALLATAPRPLTHRVRRDSHTIPGVIMADIWMRIRDKLLASPLPPGGA